MQVLGLRRPSASRPRTATTGPARGCPHDHEVDDPGREVDLSFASPSQGTANPLERAGDSSLHARPLTYPPNRTTPHPASMPPGTCAVRSSIPQAWRASDP